MNYSNKKEWKHFGLVGLLVLIIKAKHLGSRVKQFINL